MTYNAGLSYKGTTDPPPPCSVCNLSTHPPRTRFENSLKLATCMSSSGQDSVPEVCFSALLSLQTAEREKKRREKRSRVSVPQSRPTPLGVGVSSPAS